MKIVNNENVVFFDIDDTLIRHLKDDEWDSEEEKYGDELSYYSMKKRVLPIYENVNLLKAYKDRGYYVIAWSGNGYRWVETVIEYLDLSKHVDLVMTKPAKIVDDCDFADWAQRINLDPRIRK